MSGHRKWWSGHELYGMKPQEYRFRDVVYQDYPYIDLSPQNAEEMELSYWKNLYPEKVKKIQQKVEETCETMEYANSPMYDEYPDKMYLSRLGNKIYEELLAEDNDVEVKEFRPGPQPWGPGPERPPQGPPQRPPQRPPMPQGPQPPHRDSWMRDMVDVLLFQEMHRRRCERGRCKRRWY